MTSPRADAAETDASVHLADAVEDLARVRSELAAAIEEAAATGAELARRSAEIDDLNDVLETGFAVADDVIMVVSAATRRVSVWSRGAERTFGLSPEEAVGRALKAMRVRGLPGSRLSEEVARLARPEPTEVDGPVTAAVDGPAGRFELTRTAADGRQRTASVVVRLVPGSGPSALHVGAEPADDAGEPA